MNTKGSTMTKNLLLLSIAVALLCSSFVANTAQAANPAKKVTMSAADKVAAKKLYQDNCQSCHGVDRLGAMGPALLPENLARFRKNKAIKVINNGRAATQMPSFNKTLNKG